MLTIGEIIQQTYAVTGLIGQGGMGEVYEVSHLRLDRKFAIKILVKDTASQPEALARFQREARITSGLGHPHIVEIVDFNVGPDGRPFIVMELLEGESLATRLRRGRVPVEQAASIARQTTSALHAAHRKGIIHRDLKPENIFLCRRGIRDDYVKLLDFGISKVLDSKSGLTRAESLLGSPAYMAPELVREGSSGTDVRADIYSMGVVLFEMLAGEEPFKADSIYNLLYKIVNEDPPSLGALQPEVPPPVERVVARAMRKNPDQRHNTIEEFWKDLAAGLKELNVEATELIRPHHSAWPEDGALTAEAAAQEAVFAPTPLPPAISDTASKTTEVRRPPALTNWKLPAIVVAVVSALCLLAALAVHRWPRDAGRDGVVAGTTSRGADRSRVVAAPDITARPRAVKPDAAQPDTRDVTEQQPRAPDLGPDRSMDRAAVRRPRPVWGVNPDPRPQTPATLRVGTLPAAADVYLDGKKVGQSPLVLRGIKPGRHLLELRKGGKRKRLRLKLRAGQQKTVSLKLAQ